MPLNLAICPCKPEGCAAGWQDPRLTTAHALGPNLGCGQSILDPLPWRSYHTAAASPALCNQVMGRRRSSAGPEREWRQPLESTAARRLAGLLRLLARGSSLCPSEGPVVLAASLTHGPLKDGASVPGGTCADPGLAGEVWAGRRMRCAQKSHWKDINTGSARRGGGSAEHC